MGQQQQCQLLVGASRQRVAPRSQSVGHGAEAPCSDQRCRRFSRQSRRFAQMEVKRANNCPFRQLAQISGPQHSEPPKKALALGRACGSNGSCVPYGFFLSHQCWLTCRSTGPIAAGRHLGYKSLAQIPAHRNRPVSFVVIRLQFRTDCDGTDMAPHSPAAAISRNVLVNRSSNVFLVRHNTAHVMLCVRAIRPAAAGAPARGLNNRNSAP